MAILSPKAPSYSPTLCRQKFPSAYLWNSVSPLIIHKIVRSPGIPKNTPIPRALSQNASWIEKEMTRYPSTRVSLRMVMGGGRFHFVWVFGSSSTCQMSYHGVGYALDAISRTKCSRSCVPLSST